MYIQAFSFFMSQEGDSQMSYNNNTYIDQAVHKTKLQCHSDTCSPISSNNYAFTTQYHVK